MQAPRDRGAGDRQALEVVVDPFFAKLRDHPRRLTLGCYLLDEGQGARFLRRAATREGHSVMDVRAETR